MGWDGCNIALRNVRVRFINPSLFNLFTILSVDFNNIVLRRVNIYEPLLSPGVILGNVSNPMDVTLEDVNVHFGDNGGSFPYDYGYLCNNTDLKIIGDVYPKPECTVG